MPQLSRARVTVMGLGLHGGGVAAVRYCAAMGAQVTVTDLRSAEVLSPSLNEIADLKLPIVLGKHRLEDFTSADIIIKNPAVPRQAPMLEAARRAGVIIATDISLFLAELERLITSPAYPKDRLDAPEGTAQSARSGLLKVVAVTGSKGKSSTSSAIHYGFSQAGYQSFLGGNITNSPLNFVEDIEQQLNSNREVRVVLELSSFQIGDIATLFAGVSSSQASPKLYPIDAAVVTNIFRDHQDYYPDMERYVADKLALLDLCAEGSSRAVIGVRGEWHQSFIDRAKNHPMNTIDLGNDSREEDSELAKQYRSMIPVKRLVPGEHQVENLSFAAAVLETLSSKPELIAQSMASFPGVPHRLEYVGELELNGKTNHTSIPGKNITPASKSLRIKCYNDSAATIPEAALAGVRAFEQPVFLICGGSDKKLDLTPLLGAMKQAARVYLLAGSATDRLQDIIDNNDRETGNEKFTADDHIRGPFPDLSSLLDALMTDAATQNAFTTGRTADEETGDAVLLLSPGCASFGMFLNEFDRGRRFLLALKELQHFTPSSGH